MLNVKTVLQQEITDGFVNWEKFQPKLDAALKLAGNNFQSVNHDIAKATNAKFNDELTFKVTKHNTPFCYKIFKPRFVGAKLGNSGTGYFCAGLQIGTYDKTGRPVFPMPARMF